MQTKLPAHGAVAVSPASAEQGVPESAPPAPPRRSPVGRGNTPSGAPAVQDSPAPSGNVDSPPVAAARFAAYFFVHHARLVIGWIPVASLGFSWYPYASLATVLAYYSLRFGSPAFNQAVHNFVDFGSSKEPRFISAQSEAYDVEGKKYLVCLHPHGILCDPWFNLIARFHKKFAESLTAPVLDGLRATLCFAPAVQFFPLHGEMYQTAVTDVKASTVRRIITETDRSPVICPGGFSEATYAGAHPVYEYAFLRGRKGFVRLAVEHGLDIIPTYSFGANDMYRTLDWQRFWRAKVAQRTGIPSVIWWGRGGTSLPLTEACTTVSFDPFPASSYTLDQVDEAHEAYLQYLKECYDGYKHRVGSGHRELVFIGRNDPPPAPPLLPPARSKL